MKRRDELLEKTLYPLARAYIHGSTGEIEVKKIESESRYSIGTPTFNDDSLFREYSNLSERNRRNLVVLPPSSPKRWILDLICNYFAKQGFTVYSYVPPLKEERKRDDIDFKKFIRTPSMFVDYMNAMNSEVSGFLQSNSHRRFGLFGLSLGAISGSRIFGTVDNCQSAALVMGGCNLGSILWDARGDSFSRTFRENMIAQRITRENLEEELACVDPSCFVDRFKSGELFMVQTRNDEVVNISNQRELEDAWGCNNVRTYKKLGHRNVGFRLKQILRLSKEHFERTL